MPTYTKPNVKPAWGENAANPADIITMVDADVAAGWPLSATPPSRQRFNFILNWLANAVRYFMQKGLVDYDAAETYGLNSRVNGDDGAPYVSIQANNIGHTPSTSPLWWTKWGLSLAQINASQLTQANIAANDATTKVANTNFVTTAINTLTTYVNNQIATVNAAITTAVNNAQAYLLGLINNKQDALGFTPVQQGTGIGQLANVVKMGWDALSRLRVTVDATDLGYFWLSGQGALSTAVNGYVKLPNGLILQWASGYFSSADQTINFPIQFPNACFMVASNAYWGHTGDDATSGWAITAFGKTSVTLHPNRRTDSSASSTQPIIFAIGY